MILVISLIIRAAQIFVNLIDRRMRIDAAGCRRNIRFLRNGARLVLTFVRPKVPELILLDRPANRSAVLLVRKWQNCSRDWVGCIEKGVAEVSKAAAVDRIGAGLGLYIHVNAG